MSRIEWYVSPWALLIFALLYFFDSQGFYGALLPAMAVHELGHYLFLRYAGTPVRRISLGLFGAEMDYWGELEGVRGFMAVAAGPIFGFAYALCCSFGGEFWQFSGEISILLSLFNLLPVLPLDGGRIMLMAAGERGNTISRGISIVLTGAALGFWLLEGWISPLAMSLWLLWCNIGEKSKE